MAHTPVHLLLVLSLILALALARAVQADDESNCRAVQPSFPSTFKCSSGKQCISTDRASTAICCDTGNNCTSIAPITCNIQLQNASAPDANTSQLFTTRLGDRLPTCGSNTCCPFGYTCTTSGSNSPFCSMIIAQSSLNHTLATVSSAASSTWASSSPSATSSNPIAPDQSTVKKQTSFPPGVFIAGLVVGIVIGILASLTWVVCTGRHNKGDAPGPSRSSSSSQRPIISAPIPFPNNSRTDFIRRAANKTRSVFSTRAGDERFAPAPVLPDREPAPLPFTPPAQPQVHRKPSTETIQVYSPPGLMQYPSAAVPPLRAMSRQRQITPPALDHPFQTPPKMTTQTGLPFNQTGYPGAAGRHDSVHGKRGTTFTAMMAQCGIPDKGDQFPMPKPPAPYETRYRI